MSQDTMAAQVLHAVGDMRYERIPRPRPGPGQALVRVAFCGICGSDIPRSFVKGTYRFPTVIGHEFAGAVAELGPGVSGLAEGERVAVFPLLWCSDCPACEQGKFAQCLHYDYLGSRSNGALAEFVLAPARNLLPVPDGVPLALAALTEPAAVALHALRRAGPLPGQTVAVFGAGPIGLMAAQWARILGAGKVLLFDIAPHKLALARRIGFEYAFHSLAVDAVRQVEAESDGQGAHVCIEAAGAPAAARQSLAAARRGGRVVLVGNPSGDLTLPAELVSQFLRRELNLYGSWNSDFSLAGDDDDWRAVLAAMAAGSLELEPLITHRFPLAQAFAALKMMRDQTDFYAKVLIDCTHIDADERR